MGVWDGVPVTDDVRVGVDVGDVVAEAVPVTEGV